MDADRKKAMEKRMDKINSMIENLCDSLNYPDFVKLKHDILAEIDILKYDLYKL